MTMTHAEAKQLRKEIATYSRKYGVPVTANEFGVSIQTVLNSRREHGIPNPRGNPLAKSSYSIVADLIRGEKEADIARRYTVSRQFVNQCKKKMQQHGVFDAVASVISKK